MPQPDEEKIGEAIDAQRDADEKYDALTTAQQRIFRLSRRWNKRNGGNEQEPSDTEAGEQSA